MGLHLGCIASLPSARRPLPLCTVCFSIYASFSSRSYASLFASPFMADGYSLMGTSPELLKSFHCGLQDDESLCLEDHIDSDAPSAPTSILRRGSTDSHELPVPVHRRHHSNSVSESLHPYRKGPLHELPERPGTPPRQLPITTLSARTGAGEGHQPMRRSRSKQGGLGSVSGPGIAVPISVKATGFSGHAPTSELASLNPGLGLTNRTGL